MTSDEYAPGRSADLFGDPSHPTVVVWHGMQTDSRRALGQLAAMIAGHRFAVVVPDWNSHAADGGRDDLLRSIDFARARSRDPDGLVLVGWSMGGLAAAGMTLQANAFDLVVKHTVCLAGAFTARDPISGGRLTDGALDHGPLTPFTLLHGIRDDVVPPSVSTTFAATLGRAGRPVEVVEIDADHGSIAGARHDAEADRYEAADDPPTLRTASDVAARIAAVAGR